MQQEMPWGQVAMLSVEEERLLEGLEILFAVRGKPLVELEMQSMYLVTLSMYPISSQRMPSTLTVLPFCELVLPSQRVPFRLPLVFPVHVSDFLPSFPLEEQSSLLVQSPA